MRKSVIWPLLIVTLLFVGGFDRVAIAQETSLPELTPQSVLGSEVASFDHPKNIINLAWSPDSTRLASTSTQDRRIILWDVANDKKIAEITKQVSSDISGAVAFTPDDKYLVLASTSFNWPGKPDNADFSTAITLADAHTGEVIKNLPGPLIDKPLKIYDFEHNRWPDSGTPNWLESINPDPAGKFMALRFGNKADMKLELYNPQTFELEKILKSAAIIPLHDNTSYWTERVSPLNSEVVFAGFFDQAKSVLPNEHYIIDFVSPVTSMTRLHLEITHDLNLFHSGAMWTDITFSPDGRYFAVALSNIDQNHLSVWDAATGKLIRIYPTHFRSIEAVAWSRDGRLIATSSNDGRLRFWDANSTALIDDASSHGNCRSIIFSPDGSMIAYGSGDKITVQKLNRLQ